MRFSLTQKAQKKALVQFVMSAPELTLCPGLFRNISEADQLQYPVALRLEYSHNDSLLLKVNCSHLLSGFDLAVLQALELAAVGRPLIDDQDDLQADLRTALAIPGNETDVAGALSYACCSVSSLLKSVGLPVNAAYTERVYRSLDRLMNVTLYLSEASTPNNSVAFHLLAHKRTGEANRNNAVHVALNPRLTAALTGSTKQDTRLSAEELKQLGTNNAARILHQRVCAIINDGNIRVFKLSTLYSYLYPDDDGAKLLNKAKNRTSHGNYQAEQRQLESLKQAKEGLEQLHWSITVKPDPACLDDSWSIIRPLLNWTNNSLAGFVQ